MAEQNKLVQKMMGLSTEEPDLLSALLKQASRKFGPQDLLVSPPPAIAPTNTNRKKAPVKKAAAKPAPAPAPEPVDEQAKMLEEIEMARIAAMPAQEIGSFDVVSEPEKTEEEPQVSSLSQYGVELVRDPAEAPTFDTKPEKPKESDIEEMRRLIRAYGEKKDEVNPWLLAATGAADILTGRDYLKEYWQPKEKAQDARQLEAIKQLYRVGELESGMSQMQLRAQGGLAGIEGRLASQEMQGALKSALQDQQIEMKKAALEMQKQIADLRSATSLGIADKNIQGAAERQLKDLEFRYKDLEEGIKLKEKQLAAQQAAARARAASKTEKPSEYDKVADRETAKKITPWNELGGYSEGIARIKKIERLVETLDKNPGILGQSWIGGAPEGLRAAIPKQLGGDRLKAGLVIERDARALIRLKEVLDSQFAAKEAEAKYKELGIDVRLPWSLQRDRIVEALEAMKRQNEQMRKTAEWMRNNKTVRGAPSEVLDYVDTSIMREGAGTGAARGAEKTARQLEREKRKQDILKQLGK